MSITLQRGERKTDY
jgi:hypothetical protein